MELRPGYKLTEAGVIPEDWRAVAATDIVDPNAPICYGVVQVGRDVDTGVPVVAIKFVKQIGSAPLHRTAGDLERPYARSRVKSGDVLISIKGTIGRVGLVPDSFEGNISRELARLRPRREYCGEYIAHQLEADSTQARISRAVVGTTRLEFSIATLRQFQLPVPPSYSEQRAIAAALSDVDALLGGLDRLIAKKRDLKQAAMQQLLTGQSRLPGFHGEWEVRELGQLGSISGAGVDKKIRPGESPVRLVNYMDVYRLRFIRSRDLEQVVSALPDQAARCAVRKGDVFFTPSSEMPFDIAASAVAVEDIPDACYSYHVVRLRLKEDWDLRFRAYAFKTQAFLDQAARTSEGSGVRYVITQGKFRQLKTCYPSDKAEQTAIGAVLSDMDAELAALEARRAKTRALKQAMMQELLTGRTRLVTPGAREREYTLPSTPQHGSKKDVSADIQSSEQPE